MFCDTDFRYDDTCNDVERGINMTYFGLTTKHENKRVRNGFTLLEMLIVVSIIMALATIAVPKFSSAGKTAKIAKVQADIHTISNAAALYEIENGTYPANVAALVKPDKGGKVYLQGEPKLPDGSEYTIGKDGVVSGTYANKVYSTGTATPKSM